MVGVVCVTSEGPDDVIVVSLPSTPAVVDPPPNPAPASSLSSVELERNPGIRIKKPVQVQEKDEGEE